MKIIISITLIFTFIGYINANTQKECNIELGKHYGSGLTHKHTKCYKNGIYCSDLIKGCSGDKEYNTCLNKVKNYLTFKISDKINLAGEITKNLKNYKNINEISNDEIKKIQKQTSNFNEFSKILDSKEYNSFVDEQARTLCEEVKNTNKCILGNYVTYKPFYNKDEKGNSIKFLQTDGIYDNTYDETMNILNQNNFICRNKKTEAVSCKENCMKHGYNDVYGHHKGNELSCCIVCGNSNQCDTSIRPGA